MRSQNAFNSMLKRLTKRIMGAYKALLSEEAPYYGKKIPEIDFGALALDGATINVMAFKPRSQYESGPD